MMANCSDLSDDIPDLSPEDARLFQKMLSSRVFRRIMKRTFKTALPRPRGNKRVKGCKRYRVKCNEMIS